MNEPTSAFTRQPIDEEDLNLTPQAVQWLLGLDKSYLPVELAKAFPRIVNRLAKTWDDPFQGRYYLDGLLLDERGDRQGFPLRILSELIALKELRNQQHPESKDRWDCAHLIRGGLSG